MAWLAPVDEGIKEGTVLALTAFIACWMVKGQCWVVEASSRQIMECRKGEVSKGFNMTKCVVAALSLLQNLCHSKFLQHFFMCVCTAEFSCWELHVYPVIIQSFL